MHWKRKRYLILTSALLGALHGAWCGSQVYGQPTSETTKITLPAGTWFIAVRARNGAGQLSGWSNEVRVVCTAAPCETPLWWDPPAGGDPVAMYDLAWGAAPGLYTLNQLVPPTITPTPTRLPAPSIRIRV